VQQVPSVFTFKCLFVLNMVYRFAKSKEVQPAADSSWIFKLICYSDKVMLSENFDIILHVHFTELCLQLLPGGDMTNERKRRKNI
jgi:hypothetical protein